MLLLWLLLFGSGWRWLVLVHVAEYWREQAASRILRVGGIKLVYFSGWRFSVIAAVITVQNLCARGALAKTGCAHWTTSSFN